MAAFDDRGITRLSLFILCAKSGKSLDCLIAFSYLMLLSSY